MVNIISLRQNYITVSHSFYHLGTLHCYHVHRLVGDCKVHAVEDSRRLFKPRTLRRPVNHAT